MTCPRCGAVTTVISQTEVPSRLPWKCIQERRECLTCGRRLTLRRRANKFESEEA